MRRVLCVDDNQKMAEQVAEYFLTWKNGPLGPLETVVETNFKKAVQRLVNERFDLVTLDLHAETDPDPAKAGEGAKATEWEAAQQGKHVLEELKKTRFVPVIFYSGYAEKIADLKSLVVRIVKKGSNDVENVREAAQSLFNTGLPKLMRHIEEEQRSYLWDTVDAHSGKFQGAVDSDELLYLLARRIASRLARESLKVLLKHPQDRARPMELYIYPPLPGNIKTGCIYGSDEKGTHWIVATPSCDFAQGKADQVLLLGATPLTTHPPYIKWRESKPIPGGKIPLDPKEQKTYDSLLKLLRNNAGERWRFLPGTFFIPDLVVDLQMLKQLPLAEVATMSPVCTLDSPYREDFLLHLSKYYGRLGTPDLEIDAVLKKLAAV